MDLHGGAGGWIGASLLRKEDKRHLLGPSTFVADLRMPGLQDVAFVRSPVAHGKLLGIEKPAGFQHKVFSLADLAQ